MSDEYTYDLATRIAALQKLNADLQDGLKMFRLVGPGLDPEYNDQVGVAESQAVETMVSAANRAGKSLSVAAVVAAFARDKPLLAYDDRKIHTRAVKHRGQPVTIWCHDDQTEVLTDKGWRLFSRLSGREQLATVHLPTDTLQFQRPTRLFSRPYDGDMVRFYGDQKLDMLVTPNHRMIVFSDPLGREYQDEYTPTIKMADELCQKDRLKVSVAHWKGTDPVLPDFLDGVPADVFSEWLGFYIAEGCCNHGDNGNGYNNWKVVVTQKKPDGIAYYETLAARLPFTFYRKQGSTGATDFIICNKALWQYLEPLGNCYSKHVPQWVKDSPQHVIRAFLRGYFEGDGTFDAKRGTQSAYSASKQLADDIQELLIRVGLSGAVKVRPPGEYHFASEDRSGMRGEGYFIKVWQRDRATLRTRKNGKYELLYRREHYSGHVYCAEVPNGTLITRRNGKPIISGNSIGYQLNHIGETMFRLLFEPGQFRCIQDPDTGALRAWKPWLPSDAKLADATVPAPPLIPPSAINQKSWVWENKAAKQVVRVDLKNGTRFHFYPSSGEVKKGDPVHLIWIDELIQNSEHYPEWIARLTDFEGRLIWASMQYKNCPAIPAFIERESLELEEIERGERDPKNRITKVFTFKASGNPYLPKERLEINRRLYETMGDDVVAQRMDGGDVYDATLIYPYFNRTLHAAFPPNEDHWDDLAKVLHPLSGIPPKDWTHELAIDPGAQKPAVLFMATPPKVWKDENGKEWSLWSEKPYFVPYDEIYGQRYTLKELCELIQIKMRGIRFRRFIMDMQGGRISSMVGGASPKILFAEEFARLGIESQETGINFVAGSPDFRKRKRIVEDWMQVHPSGYPQLRIANKRCPHLVWQLANNQLETKDKEGRLPVDKPKQRERNDLRTCLEYIASLHPTYVPVPQHTPLPDWYQRAMEWEGKFFGNESRKSDRCHFGPGVAP